MSPAMQKPVPMRSTAMGNLYVVTLLFNSDLAEKLREVILTNQGQRGTSVMILDFFSEPYILSIISIVTGT